MNPYGSLDVPDYVPDDWQERYGGERPGHLDPDQPTSHEVAPRLLIWLVTVVVTLVAVMWLSTLVPRLVAVASVVAVGVTAGVLLTRWVLQQDPRSDEPRR
jgi:uncharacterized protein involved in exopolysaccharide biosynthesis